MTNTKFDPQKRIIAPLEAAVWNIKRGELINVVWDLETMGLGRENVPYSMPNAHNIIDIGAVRADIAGNIIGLFSVDMRRPEYAVPSIEAALVTRAPDGIASYDDPKRTNPYDGIASFVSFLDQSAYAYKDFGDEQRPIKFDYYKRGRDVEKRRADVTSIPFLDANGHIIEDHVRLHQNRNMLAYKTSKNPADPFYDPLHTEFYYDHDTHSYFKCVPLDVQPIGFNNHVFDNPAFRGALSNVGYPSRDAAMMTSSSTRIDKRRGRMNSLDVRHLLKAHDLYGPKGDSRLRLPEIIDPITGRLKRTEALTAFAAQQNFFANNALMHGPGYASPLDQSRHDPALDHGGLQDSLVTRGLMTKAMHEDPWIFSNTVRQTDKKERKIYLSRSDSNGKELPIHNFPTRDRGLRHDDAPYFRLGDDAQLGDNGREILINTLGNLEEHKNLDIEGWVALMDKEARDPDRVIRLESQNTIPPAFYFKDVRTRTSQGARYNDKLAHMMANCHTIVENPDMIERIRSAIEIRQVRMRFNQYTPSVTRPEDDFYAQCERSVNFMRNERDAERASLNAGNRGPKRIEGIVECINSGMNKERDTFYNSIVDAFGHLCGVANRADNENIAEEFADHPDIDQCTYEEEELVIDKFANIAAKTYKTFIEKAPKYARMMAEITNPVTGKPYMQGKKFKKLSVETRAEAVAFRDAMSVVAMRSEEMLLTHKYISPWQENYVNGLVDTNFTRQALKGKPLLLLPDIDAGGRGAMPHVVDGQGRRIEAKFLIAQNQYVGTQNRKGPTATEVMKKIVEKQDWRYRFYTLRSNPTMARLVQRMVNYDKAHLVPPNLYRLYRLDRQERLYGFPNESATTDRAQTFRSLELDIDRLNINAPDHAPHVKERSADPGLGAIERLARHDEGMRILSGGRAWIKQQKRNIPFDKKLQTLDRFDTKSGLPLPCIEHTINRDTSVPFDQDPNFIVVDAPAFALREPIEQYDYNELTPRLVIVPKINHRERQQIERGRKKVIFREMETGRMYGGGVVNVLPMPDEHAERYKHTVFTPTRKAYGRAGQEIESMDAMTMLAIENLYPLANTRDMSRISQAQNFNVPAVQVDAMQMPELVAMGKTPLRAILLPAPYCPQNFKLNGTLLLSEIDTAPFSNLEGENAVRTGHVFTSRLRKVYGMDEHGNKTGMTSEQFLTAIRKGTILTRDIDALGVQSPLQLETLVHNWEAAKWKDGQFLLFTFDQVNKAYHANDHDEKRNAWAYFNPIEPPVTALVRDRNPVAPSCYLP